MKTDAKLLHENHENLDWIGEIDRPQEVSNRNDEIVITDETISTLKVKKIRIKKL